MPNGLASLVIKQANYLEYCGIGLLQTFSITITSKSTTASNMGSEPARADFKCLLDSSISSVFRRRLRKCKASAEVSLGVLFIRQSLSSARRRVSKTTILQ